MKVGIIQPSYIPWRGYFDFIDSVDLFIFYDDVQYSKQSWRNRNRIKTHTGVSWLTVPVYDPHMALIKDVQINNTVNWRDKQLKTMEYAYSDAPYFQNYFPEFSEILKQHENCLCALDIRLTTWLMEKLEIKTTVMLASELDAKGSRTDRLVDVLTKVKADSYLSGPSASAYLDIPLLRSYGIDVEYKSYDYKPYPQLYGEFEPAVSVLDLLFNTGPKARDFLISETEDIKIPV